MFKEFFQSFLTLYIEMVPFLAFGLLVAGVLHVVVNKSFILNHFGSHGILSVIKAAVLGVPLPLCSCSVVPTGLSLKKHGASNGATLSFLISTPQTGVESIAATWGMMGPFFAIFRPFAAFITGIIGGIIGSSVTETSEITTEHLENTDTQNKRTPWESVKELIHYGFVELMDDIGPNLLVGVLVSAVITVFIPDSLFTRFTGIPFLEMIIVLLGAVPLYVCATASIPIAAALIMKGISPGAAFVFLMAGPATNAATITVLYSKLGKKMGTIYLSVIVVSSLILGGILNWSYSLFNPEFISEMAHQHHEMKAITWWQWLVITTFTLFLLRSIWITKLKVPVIRFFRNNKKAMNGPTRIYSVGGMTCNNCAGHVEDAAKLLSGVATATVDLERMELKVTGVVDETTIKEAVNKAGYSFDKLLRGSDFTRTFSVTGMSCQNCVRHVTEAVVSLKETSDVEVSLDTSTLSLTGIESDDSIVEAVAKAGYQIVTFND